MYRPGGVMAIDWPQLRLALNNSVWTGCCCRPVYPHTQNHIHLSHKIARTAYTRIMAASRLSLPFTSKFLFNLFMKSDMMALMNCVYVFCLIAARSLTTALTLIRTLTVIWCRRTISVTEIPLVIQLAPGKVFNIKYIRIAFSPTILHCAVLERAAVCSFVFDSAI